jgi:DNA polymerase III delta prime subunit
MKTSIWVERYRPKSIKDVIFQDERQREKFKSFIAAGDIPHLFLSGVQGTGKTSTSLSLIKDLNVASSDVLKINCSDEKIEALRNRVTSFAMSMPLGDFKVVRLEEVDYLSLESMALLRALIEETSRTCRYIATCNYANRVIPALKSRFQEFYFKAPDKEKVAVHVAEILEKEQVEYDAETLLTYVDVGYPDIRKIIQLLQGNVQNGKLLNPQQMSSDSADWKFGLLDAISAGDFKRARKLVCESATREEHEDVYTFLYTNIERMKVSDKEAAIVTIAEYLKSHALVSDTEINLAACFISLGKL